MTNSRPSSLNSPPVAPIVKVVSLGPSGMRATLSECVKPENTFHVDFGSGNESQTLCACTGAAAATAEPTSAIFSARCRLGRDMAGSVDEKRSR